MPDRILVELHHLDETMADIRNTLRVEKRWRRIWIITIFGLITLLGVIQWENNRDSNRQDQATCAAMNDGRERIRAILALVAVPPQGLTPDQLAARQVATEEFKKNALTLLPQVDCDKVGQ
jgi:hypothetical protein